MSRKFLITEEERRHIRSMYGLITEDIDPNSGGTVTITNKYQAGFYTTAAIDRDTNKTIKSKLDAELVKVTEFVKKYPNSIVSVKFTSQESSLPNTDNEKAGYFKKNRLDVGELSNARKEYINQYIQSYFQSLKDQGIIQSEVQIPPVEYEFKEPVKVFMGTKDQTPWCVKGDPQIPADDTQGYACTGKDYKVNGSTTNNWWNQKQGIYKKDFDEFYTEQNSSIEITVRLNTTTITTTSATTSDDCATGLTIRVYVPKHQCQNAEFFIFANSTLLYNTAGGMTANLNNDSDVRGIPKASSEPLYPPEALNPGYGYLKNGDGNFGGYKYGTINTAGDIGAGRSDTFVVTEEQSKTIVSQGNGVINIWMVGTTSSVHVDLPYVEITRTGDPTPILPATRPKVKQGLLLSLDKCGNKVTGLGSSETAPDVSGYIELLKSEKFDVIAKLEKDNIQDQINSLTNKEKKELKKSGVNIDEKAILLDRVDDLVLKMDEIVAKIKSYTNLPTITTEQKIELNNYVKTEYTNLYNLLNGDPSLVKNSDGDYVNKTINDNDLFGDVRLFMTKFWDNFNKIYLYDGTYNPSGNGYAILQKNFKGVA